MNIYKGKSFLYSRKAFYLVMLTAFAALIGVTFLFVSEKDTVSARQDVSDEPPAAEQVTGDMLRYALNFRSATNFAVLAEDGVSGSARVEGNVGVLREGALIKGISHSNLDFEFDRSKARTDLMNAFSAMNQLPCQEVDDSELGGKTFAPGVYCLSSARIAGEMTLDAKGDADAVFIFRVLSGFKAEAGSRISLANEAIPSSVFFASNDTATIGEGSEFNANVLARNLVQVLGGARVTGRTVSVEGEVQLDGDVVQQTGVLQICKQVAGAGLENRIFRFEIAGVVYEAPVGGCTPSITLPVGGVVVTELTDGRFTNQTGTWSGRFRLLDVNSQSFTAISAVNLPQRTAVINVREGGMTDRTIVNFVNTFAINAVIRICKYPAVTIARTENETAANDEAAEEFFNFTVDALPNTVFTVPMGQCSELIQVNIPTVPGPLQSAVVRVTEIGRAGYRLAIVTTNPSSRLISFVLNSGISNINACSTTGPGTVPSGCIFSNSNGGYATVQVIEGGATSATTIDFHNANIPVTNPGGVRVCKVAGPGIPVGTRFRFEVRGLIVSDAVPTVSGVRFVDVAAGSAAEGGNCEFVRDENEAVTRFAINSNVFIQEIGAIDPIPNLGSGEIRVSRIRLNRQLTGFPDPGVVTLPDGGQISLSPNPNLNTRQAVITARSNFQEIEFTNFVFQPTLLRICKIAGKGVLQGTPFTFDVTIQNPDGLFSNQAGGLPAAAIPVTVQAGPPKQGGFCTFVQGPFPAAFSNPTVGTFPTGATVTVTERAAGASVLAVVTSSTGNPNVNLAGRSATLTLGFANSFNELTFTNARNSAQNDARFDFDGDGKTDFSVFRPSTGEWWYMQSTDGNDRSFPFGASTDRIVPADYTGDGVTDIAFFRPTTNQWFILRSENLSFFSVTFGAAGDIPVPADFDGDGEADLAVFRPSESNWYINRSSGGLTIVRFGTDGDFPVPADYDGDGAADLAVFRPSVGEWWILRSSDGESRAFRFGSSTDKPVPADYTGDGRADIAFYRPSTGEWFVLRSEDNSFYSAPFGESGDIPVPGDYDGDEREDFAVFRPSNHTWYVAKSSGGFSVVRFGISGDRPVPAAFIQ